MLATLRFDRIAQTSQPSRVSDVIAALGTSDDIATSRKQAAHAENPGLRITVSECVPSGRFIKFLSSHLQEG